MSTLKRNQKFLEIDPSEICSTFGSTKKQKLGDQIESVPEDQFQNGAITYIHLKDFMGHQEFEWTPGPRVNVVTGIGKSLILNAIRIGLGENFNSNVLKKYVRNDASEAVITIQIYNGNYNDGNVYYPEDPDHHYPPPYIELHTIIGKDGQKSLKIECLPENECKSKNIYLPYSFQI